MFEHNRFIFIGPATAVVQAAITQTPGQTSGRQVNFAVSAKNVTEQDVSDFTLLAAQGGEGVTLTIRTESLRVDETDANGQTTVVLQDGQPVAELGVSMEDVTPPPGNSTSDEYLKLLRATAQRFNIPVKEETAEHSLAVEGLEDGLISGNEVGSILKLRSGATFVCAKKADTELGYYLQEDLSRTAEDQDFFDQIRSNREEFPARISFILNTESDTEAMVPEALNEISRVEGVSVYIVKPGTVRTSISAANESLRTSWNIKVPSILRARRRNAKA